ncbi:NYN domain-containing protein [Amycolatopsis sp. NPDC059021]|uniref:NYN domain-containing protein n=1 Tax=Amycolatopsis sp. NPDC059021 TaxID=3346704 RepID=UPI0036718160
MYVDAGYLLAAAATRITGTSLRSGIEVDHERLIKALVARATECSGLPLLRVHWYDAAANGVPNRTQEEIGLLPKVKVRLGRIGVDGEQKGVDLRIGLDMVAHARNAAVEVIFLVSGDDDLSVAVEEAQAHGAQVSVLAVPTREGAAHGVSRHLLRAADGLELLAADDLDAALTPRGSTTPASASATSARSDVPSPSLLAHRARPATPGRPTPSALDTGTPARTHAALVCSSSTSSGTALAPGFRTVEDVAEPIDEVVSRVLKTWLGSATPHEQAELIANRPSIPRDIDRALLQDLSDVLGVYDLNDVIRHELRARFWRELDESARA